MSGMIRILTLISISLILSACGGGGGGDNPWYSGPATDTPTTTTPGSTSPGGGTTTAATYLGSGSGASFSQGTLSIGVSSLSAGGQTSVTANIADASGNLFQESASVSFTSGCVASSLATITSPVVTTTGVATATYEAQGCAGPDTITATATVNGVTRTATGSLTVQSAVIGSLSFVSAEPTNIGIRGFGLVEVSRVSFRVLDTNGNPVGNEQVNFSLNTQVGGIDLSDTSAVSDSTGLVSVDVQSGTINTTVRVTASLASNPNLSTQSDGLRIGTGISDQNSFTLSASLQNPEGWEQDYGAVTITVHASDHFNNPVPDGTAVSFVAEGGSVETGCLTTKGACSVDWLSSDPKPLDGRVSVRAAMIGEESFVDTNGNGVLDIGDVDNAADVNGDLVIDLNDVFYDLPEAFLDNNEDGVRSPGEEILDFNSDGLYNEKDGLFNGVLCCDDAAISTSAVGDACYGMSITGDSFCSPEKNVHASDNITLVMAKTTLDMATEFSSLSVNGEVITTMWVNIHGTYPGPDGKDDTADDVWQVPPMGTTISVAVTNGSLESDASYVVPNMVKGELTAPPSSTPVKDRGGYTFKVYWKGDTTPSDGYLKIRATVPSGLVNVFELIPISDVPPTP